MDRRFWGVSFIVVSLLVAAWIYLDLQTNRMERGVKHVRSLVDEVDSIANEGMAAKRAQPESRTGKTLSDQLRGNLNDLNRRPTDSLQKIIAEENLLDSGSKPK